MMVRRLGAVLGFFAIASGDGRVAAQGIKEFVTVSPTQINWQNVPGGLGTKFAVIQGDPARAGLYVIRVKFPPHVMDTPHTHPKDRYVTVLKGTWYAGTGKAFDPAKAKKLPTGSFMFHPGGEPHWDGSAGNEEVIVEITGEGPGNTSPLDVTEPMWRKVR